MNVTFACPQCDQAARLEIQPTDRSYCCPHCQQKIEIPAGSFEGDKLKCCLACPSTDLFVRKDFPQQIGVGLVVIGIVASCIPWAYGHPYWTYAILFATAMVDLVLYLVVPECLMCYRCGAQYRMVPGLEEHAAFDLETHEKHRQQKIRLAETQAAEQYRANLAASSENNSPQVH